MIMPTRESVAGAARLALGLALFLALGGAAMPLAAQARAQGGHSEGSAGEASHARSEPGGDRGSWNHGGGGSGSGGSSGGGATASPGSGSSSSGNDGSTAQPRSSSPGGDRGQWNNRSNRGGSGGHHGSRGRGHYGYGHRYGGPYYTNPWWGWWGWGWGWGEPYGVYGGYGGYGRGYGEGDDQGALDLDIWPGDTQVWLDGQNIGTVDDFDGFPTYLWLERGTYDLVFYREGYQTLARQYSIYPGLTVDVGDRLVPGDSIRPEDLPTKTHVRRDTRVEEERERSERIDNDRGRYRDRDLDRYPDEQGRLLLSIEPGDASVYLDGKFIGTAEEIGRLHRGLMVEAGQHRISVVRPGRRGSEQTVTVGPGAEEEIDIQLEKSDE